MSASLYVFLALPDYGLKMTEAGHVSVGHTHFLQECRQTAAHAVSLCQSEGGGRESNPDPLKITINP